MSRLHVYLDLDRTLFQTEGASRMLWQQIAHFNRKIKLEAELARQDTFYVSTDETNRYYYDFTAHLRAAGLESGEVYPMLRGSPLADDRLLFPGAAQLVDWLKPRADVAILTYGADDYQRLKAALCPALARVPVHTLIGDKLAWLEGKGPLAMVDDKPLVEVGRTLPSGVYFIQVSLEGAPLPSVPWPVFGTLDEVTKYFTHNIDKLSRLC